MLGLDLSTVRTGWALGDAASITPRLGVWKLPGASEDVIDHTLGGCFESIATLCKVAKVRDVVIEAPIIVFDRSAHTAQALIQLTGAARAAAHLAGARVRLVAVQTVRRHFIGHGGMKSKDAKQAVLDRCRQLGWAVELHDAADAGAVWHYGMCTLNPTWAARSTPMFASVA